MAVCDAVYESDKEIKRILEEKDAQNTKRTTKTAIRTFQSFIRDLETLKKAWKIWIKAWQVFLPMQQKRTATNTKPVL